MFFNIKVLLAIALSTRLLIIFSIMNMSQQNDYVEEYNYDEYDDEISADLSEEYVNPSNIPSIKKALAFPDIVKNNFQVSLNNTDDTYTGTPLTLIERLQTMNFEIDIEPPIVAARSIIEAEVGINNYEERYADELDLIPNDIFRWFFKPASISASNPFQILSQNDEEYVYLGSGKKLPLKVDEDVREGMLNLTIMAINEENQMLYKQEITRYITVQRHLKAVVKINEFTYYDHDFEVFLTIDKKNQSNFVNITCIFYGLPTKLSLSEKSDSSCYTENIVSDDYYTLISKQCLLQPGKIYDFICVAKNELSNVDLHYSITTLLPTLPKVVISNSLESYDKTIRTYKSSEIASDTSNVEPPGGKSSANRTNSYFQMMFAAILTSVIITFYI